MMHTSPVARPDLPPVSSREFPRSMKRAERAYQGLTIAAMIVLLSSLFLFW
jgi:hypothetical protein